MVELMDHGSSSGSVAVDASTYRVHLFAIVGSMTIGAPTGLDDGETVLIMIKNTSGNDRALAFDAALIGFPPFNVSNNQLVYFRFTKVGSDFFSTSGTGYAI